PHRPPPRAVPGPYLGRTWSVFAGRTPPASLLSPRSRDRDARRTNASTAAARRGGAGDGMPVHPGPGRGEDGEDGGGARASPRSRPTRGLPGGQGGLAEREAAQRVGHDGDGLVVGRGCGAAPCGHTGSVSDDVVFKPAGGSGQRPAPRYPIPAESALDRVRGF